MLGVVNDPIDLRVHRIVLPLDEVRMLQTEVGHSTGRNAAPCFNRMKQYHKLDFTIKALNIGAITSDLGLQTSQAKRPKDGLLLPPFLAVPLIVVYIHKSPDM